MSKIIVNSLTNWQDLPWIKIQARIYQLQTNIYKASRECKIGKLNALQKAIINSSDAKVIAIRETAKYFFKYYVKRNRVKFVFSNHDKWVIYKALYRNCTYDKYINYITGIVKQYIVYIYTEPEWKAKVENNCIFSIRDNKRYCNVQCVSKLLIMNKYAYDSIYKTYSKSYNL